MSQMRLRQFTRWETDPVFIKFYHSSCPSMGFNTLLPVHGNWLLFVALILTAPGLCSNSRTDFDWIIGLMATYVACFHEWSMSSILEIESLEFTFRLYRKFNWFTHGNIFPEIKKNSVSSAISNCKNKYLEYFITMRP